MSRLNLNQINYVILKFIFFILVLSSFLACSNQSKKYKIAISDPSTSLNRVGVAVVELLEKELNIQFDVLDQTGGSVEHLKLLSENKIDFAIALTTVGSDDFEKLPGADHDNIRTITPLYNQNLYIIYPDSLKPKNLKSLIKGRKIGLGVAKGSTAGFTKNILKEFGIDSTEYIPVYTKNKDNYCNELIDVSCSFTSFKNERIVQMLLKRGNRIFSLGDVDMAFSGSAVDGVCKKLWTAKPIVIAKNSYYSKPQKPALTISVFTSLLCKKDMEEELIQDIIDVIIKNKSTLIKQNPVINQVSEDNLNETLFYPFHLGIHLFLERNDPSFVEQYAEVIALILTILIILSGILSSYRKWNKQRKKDRIDIYYEQVLEIVRSINIEDVKNLERNLKMLYKIRETAFENLIKERLNADESFKIFLDLITDSINKLENSLSSAYKK